MKAGAPTTAAFDSAEEEAIRTIVRAYLTDHPEILVEALNGYEDKQRVAQETAMQENAVKNLAAISSAAWASDDSVSQAQTSASARGHPRIAHSEVSSTYG